VAGVILPDGTRCDCLANTRAIEFDVGSKSAEAIGQTFIKDFKPASTPASIEKRIRIIDIGCG
jgi:hypothetical protein